MTQRFAAGWQWLRRYHLALYLGLCLLLGGASAAGALANLLLQLLGIVLFVLTLGRAAPPLTRSARWVLAITGAAGALLVLQIIPLPPSLWTLLPGRADIASSFGLIPMPLPWMPVSLTPDATIAALLSLIPALAVLAMTLRADETQRRAAVITVIAIAALSIGVGLMQVAGGETSPLYFYAITSRGQSVGFFPNRNHLATLLLMTIPLVGALIDDRLLRTRIRDRRGRLAAVGIIGVLLCVGIFSAGSIAGWLLSVPVLLATYVLIRRQQTGRIGRVSIVVASGAGVLALLFAIVAPFSLATIDAKIGRSDPHLRAAASATSAAVAVSYFPVGSGGGSFVSVYPSHEDPRVVDNEFLNHVHNDYIEVWLEHGLPGILLILAALTVWLGAARRLWARGSSAGDLQRAAFIILGIGFTHSLVDYPLRTAALSALFAFAAMMMAGPSPPGSTADGARAALPRHRRPSRRTIAIALDPAGAPPADR